MANPQAKAAALPPHSKLQGVRSQGTSFRARLPGELLPGNRVVRPSLTTLKAVFQVRAEVERAAPSFESAA